MIPSLEVFRADGNHCRGFALKVRVIEKPMGPSTVEKAVIKTSRYLWKA
jgi:hypothetical protein